MSSRHAIIPASYVLLKKEGQYLFSRRFQTGYEDGKWSLPAGHVEEGETFTQCVIRETKEEIGVDISGKDLRVAHVLQRDSQVGEVTRHRMDIFFVCEVWKGVPKNLEPNKCDGLEWFSVKDLPEVVIPYIHHVIKMIQKDIGYSEYGFNKIETAKNLIM